MTTVPHSSVSDGGDTAPPSTDRSPNDRLGTDRTTAGAVDSTHDRRLELLVPNYGPVRVVLGLLLFYVLVDRATPAALDAVEGAVPTFAPEPFATLLAMLLWLVAGLTAVTLALEQRRDNPRRFDDPADRDAFLAAVRPTGREYALNAERVVLGTALAVIAWDTAMVVLTDFVVVVAADGTTLPATLTVGNVLIFAAFFVGFGAAARGLDRLVVGAARDRQSRQTVG